VTRIEGDYVFVRWINSDFGETAEYQAHCDDVTPLAGWLAFRGKADIDSCPQDVCF
jgi:hypothetical protein